MVGAVGLIVALLVYGRWRLRINHGFGLAAKWVERVVTDPKTYRVAETFCIEAAVLWFVFPLLDSLYDRKNVDSPLVHRAFGVSAAFFIFAVVLSHAAGKED